MPEIAEVETVRRTLLRQILNKHIKNVQVLYNKMIKTDLEKFHQILTNNYFIDIKRKGKWLIFELNNCYLLSHLRMEGKYFVKDSNEPILKHEHVIISFDDGTDLRYHDTRKFGVMYIAKTKEDVEKILNNLGIEVGSSNLTSEYLISKLKNKQTSIKTLLLDQSIIAGLGNIYANEVLFASHINPHKKGLDINYKEAQDIIDNASKIIDASIKMGGTTIKSYTSSLGVTGKYQDYLMIHKKEGEPCKICGELIKKDKINGRSTYYCPKCQK